MAYKKKKDAPSRNTYRIEFGMSELRLDLGIVNSGLDSVKESSMSGSLIMTGQLKYRRKRSMEHGMISGGM